MDSAAGTSTNIVIMEDYRMKDRSVNFTTQEVNRLQLLVDKYKHIIMCKKPDGTSTKQKDHAWRSIETEFNAIGQIPRSIKQLKYKFENMKRSAKKEACRERQEMRRTGGGQPPSLPPGSEDATDWLRSIMSGTIDGNEAVYDDDIIMTSNSITNPKIVDNPIAVEIISIEKKDNTFKMNKGCDAVQPVQKNEELDSTICLEAYESVEEETTPAFDCSTPHSSLKRPMAPQLKRVIKKKQAIGNENKVKEALREKKLSVLDGLYDLELEKIRQNISQQKELHSQIMKQNEEKHKLEVLKLQLEIDILKKNLNK